VKCWDPDNTARLERIVAVDLLMQVIRGDDNRLSGTIRVKDGDDSRSFSGTLELMRVFEDLVPIDPTGDGSGGPSEGGLVP
jgi:hypothetical protein